jgi:NTE family protein
MTKNTPTQSIFTQSNQKTSNRIQFLAVSTLGMAAATAGISHAATPQASQTEGNIANQLIDSTAQWNDGLAHPIPYQNPPGTGKEKGLALGGGGLILIAFYVGYFKALRQNNINLADADVVVGTSAGSIFGSMLMSGYLWRLDAEIDLMADFPKLVSTLLPKIAPNPSQLRASGMALNAKDASPFTIQSIGHAALAARNDPNSTQAPEVISKLIGISDWASPKLYTTSNDCYTGQRLVVSHEAGIPMNVACSASASLPGGVGPTFLKDRLGMDGGICQTSTHSDVIAGVKKAIVFSLGHGTPEDIKQGLRTSGLPNTLLDEIKMLEAQGAQTKLIVAGLPPGIDHVKSILDPALIEPYLKYGHERGLADASDMAKFW